MFHYWFIEREMKARSQEAWRETQRHRLLREARMAHQGWLSRQRCWLLTQSGHLLILLGQQLQRHGQPQTILLEGRINGGALSSSGE